MKNILLHSPEYAELAHKLAAQLDYEQGEIELKTFPDGERYMRILTDVRDCDVFFLGAAHCDTASLQSFDLACGLVEAGAKRLTLILPYFGYSTMERRVAPGEIVTAKNRARLYSSIPKAPYGNRIFLLDLHAEGIPHYFEGNTFVFHLYAKPVIIAGAKALGGEDFVLGSTDSGRAKWVESLANDMGVQAAFIYKKRLSATETKVTAVNAHVEGKHVIIYDDMIRTGGSLIGAAQAYMDAGAQKLSVITTHGIFPAQAVERLKSSGLITQVSCTDSHPNAVKQAQAHPDFLTLLGIEDLLAKAIQHRT